MPKIIKIEDYNVILYKKKKVQYISKGTKIPQVTVISCNYFYYKQNN